jgi:THO complex subunit 4
MVDYWQNGTATTETDGAANGAAQPAANGDANMDDEILVSCIRLISEN